MNISSTADDAVAAALAQKWKEAIRINTALLVEDQNDIDALCRLAFAYLNVGQFSRAKETYEKVLTIDAYHQIALKNLKKLGVLKRKDVTGHTAPSVSPMMFLEEPGKTKIAECVHLAPTQVLSTLASGQEVTLKAKNHVVEVRSLNNRYLAALPDDLSFKLIKFLNAGNRYQAIIKGVEKQSLKIFLRELARGKRFTNQPSFTSTTSYIPFAKGGTLGDGQEGTLTEEGESDQTQQEEG